MKINHVELQNEIHAQNKAVGWWDKPRPFHVFACLFHSELSEAMEGDRKTLKDDHLPQYDMFWVEVADFVIRAYDWLGSKNHTKYEFGDFWVTYRSNTDFLVQMHCQVSGAVHSFEDPYYRNTGQPANQIAAAVVQCYGYARSKGVNLQSIIKEKVEYNKTRDDHKRENRAKPEGKKY